MKKITLFLLLIATFSFSQTIDLIDFEVTEPIGKDFSSGTRFDFKFKIKGNYTYSEHGYNQIDLILYKNTVSSANEIARSYWNREDDVDLIFINYTTKNWWNTALINYSTHPGQVFKLVVNYANLTKTLTYTIPIPIIDTDNDGVADNIDNCPNEAGPASNNGCPLQANLKISSLKISKQSNDQVIFDYPNGNTDTPTLNNNNWYDITVGVKNDGQAVAQSVSLDVIFTNNTSNEYPHPSVPFYGVETDADIGDISLNQFIEKTFSIYVGNKIGTSPNLSNNSIYRLFFDIDINDDIGETNENDNIKFTQFIYSSLTNKGNSKLMQLQPIFEEVLKPYSIDVYTFQGQKILSKEVTSKEEENKQMQSLSSGIYIVKSKDKTYKISIK